MHGPTSPSSVAALSLSLAGAAVITAAQQKCMLRIGLQLRTALSAMVFRKSLTVSMSGAGGATTGEIVTLMSSDARKFEQFLVQMPSLVIAPVMLGVCFHLLHAEIGDSMWAGLVFMLAAMPLVLIMFGKLSSLFAKVRLLPQHRVRGARLLLRAARCASSCSCAADLTAPPPRRPDRHAPFRSWRAVPGA
jgi:ABC-type multidrug transport system fused ATPase/permease subunit